MNNIAYKLVNSISKGFNSLFGTKVITASDFNRFFPGFVDSGQSVILNSSRQYLNAYQIISYVGQAVLILSSDIASLKHELQNAKGEKINDPRVEDFLKNPGVNLSRSDLLTMSAMHLLLDGNFFWLPESSNVLSFSQSRPDSITILNPALTDIYDSAGLITTSSTISNSNQIGRYETHTGVQTLIDLESDAVIQGMSNSPHNALRGMGRVQQNAPLLEVDRFTTIFNNQFFRQGAKMTLAISLDHEMSSSEFKKNEEQLREKYEGNRNWSKLFISPSTSKIQTLNVSHKDMEFLEQKKMTRQDVFGIFQVPPIISGIMEDAKYDSAEEQEEVYWNINLPRVYTPIEEALNTVIGMISPGVTFRFVKKSFIDIEKQNALASSMFDRGVVTGNEAREMVGLSRDDSDQFLNTRFQTFNYIPVGTAIETNEAILAQTQNQANEKTSDLSTGNPADPKKKTLESKPKQHESS